MKWPAFACWLAFC